MLTIGKIKSQFLDGNQRTAKANKNVIYSFLIKGISIGSQFALVPLTLHYLEKERYGIWLTLASLVGWFGFFDIGIGNGLRNKLSEALANNDIPLARTYVSTSYGIVAAIFLTLMVIFWIVNPFLNWSSILNASPELQLELSKIALFVFTFFCLQFILTLIGNVLYAHQEPALNNLINPIGSVLSLIVIYILTITTKSSLFWVSIVFSAVPLLVLLFFNLFFFGGSLRYIAPDFKHIHIKHSRKLFGLGLQFFIIQVAFIVLYSSSSIVLAQLFGPEEVTVYNVAYKYFTVGLMINNIVMATYWSAFTDAYVRKEFDWIKRTIKRLERTTYFLMGLIVISCILANLVFRLWLGPSIIIPYSIQWIMCGYAIISLYAAPQHIFLNGSGKIRLQLYTAVFSIIVTVPLAIYFCKTLKIGPAGVILSMICTTLPVTILYKIQYAKIMNGTAKGLWSR
jgi:O-antigen/teichoic acid export membrane protein